MGVCVFYHDTVCFACVRFDAFFYLYGFFVHCGACSGYPLGSWKSDVFRESVFRKLCLFRLVYINFKLVMFGLQIKIWFPLMCGGIQNAFSLGVDIGLVSTLLLSL